METDATSSAPPEDAWDNARCGLDGLPGGRGINMAHEAVDRHAAGPLADCPALRWLGRGDETVELTYRRLAEQSNRFANILSDLGLARGETVCVLSDRLPALYAAALGIWKFGAVFCPLFPVFGPEPLATRLAASRARVLLTGKSLYEGKVADLRDRLPNLAHVILTDAADHAGGGLWSYSQLMTAADRRFTIPPTDPEDRAILHYTSGTSGNPKGAVHVHDAARVHAATGREVLALAPGTVFWCTADPAWVTGTSYGILAPLMCGALNVVDGEDFDPERWLRILSAHQVEVWYTTPTALRRLMRSEASNRKSGALSCLSHIFSVGEALHPDIVAWSRRRFGVAVRDTWWQTETGGIMLATLPGEPVRPGSIGRPLRGIDAALVHLDPARRATVIQNPGAIGQLALKPGWPSRFRGYLEDPEQTRRCYAGEWYLTGDLMRRDGSGYFSFVGRADDIIKTAGHLVGPAEVERALMTHPAVSEAGVVGKPDPVSGQIVKAYVTLKPGTVPVDSLRLDIIGHARSLLGAALAPREIEFTAQLPKNRAGKILRRLLREGG
jgi:acetyl-CoA synthetase